MSYLSILLIGLEGILCWWKSVSKCALKCVTIPNCEYAALVLHQLQAEIFRHAPLRLTKLRESRAK